MPQQYDKNMTGLLFKNTSTNPAAPRVSGFIEIDNVEYDISLWICTDKQSNKPKKDKNDNQFYTAKISLKDSWKDDKQDTAAVPANKEIHNILVDDEPPF